MQHECSACHMKFRIDGDSRSQYAWGRLRSAYSLNINRGLDHFNLVTCPSCGTVDVEPKLKVLGLFTPAQFKVVIVVAAAVSIVVAFWQGAQ
jgi:hypothetical protein